MTSPFMQGLLTKVADKTPIRQTLPALAAAPVATGTAASKKRYNPFLTALDTDSNEFKEVYGVNRPLGKAMFLGYRDDKPIYGGERLFILY